MPNTSSKPQSQQVNVGTVAARLDVIPAGTNPTRVTLRVYNTDVSKTLYFGFNATVLPATGCPLVAQSYVDLDISELSGVWGVSPSGIIDVRVLEVYL